MANSVVGAVIAKWSSLSFSGKPSKLWFDGVPLRDGTTVVSLPTVELIDNGTRTEDAHGGFDFEYHPYEVTRVTFVIRAVTLNEADDICDGLKYNAGAVTAGSGYDFGTLTVTGHTFKAMVRESERRSREPSAHDPEGKPVHRVDVNFRVETQRTA